MRKIDMRKIKTQNAVGYTICHDITRITKDAGADVWFKKGHVIKECDIDHLISIGKEDIYIYENIEGMIHEEEGAGILYDICKNTHIYPTDVTEGKIEAVADIAGLLKVDIERLQAINEQGDIIIATLHNNTVVAKDQKIAGMRIIPLLAEKSKLETVKRIAGHEPILQIKPFYQFSVAVITTGNEIYYNRTPDTFTPVIEKKLAAFNLKIDYHKIVEDDVTKIVSAIKGVISQGATLIICTGGMSVDPNDLTPTAIKEAGANILTYGAPVLPGSMLLIGYIQNNIPILGLPGCVMYRDATGFDLFLPRILARDAISKKEIAKIGHGGFCRKCETCGFPHCEFGR